MSSDLPVCLPKLGMAVTEGVLVRWLVDDDQVVGPGDPLYVLETDKVESEVESPGSGRIRRSGIEGNTYQVGDEVARLIAG